MNKIFKVVWNEKKGCNVVTSEKGKSTCRFRGSARLAAMAILGLTVITSGVNTASAEGATTTVGTIEVNTSNNLTYIGGHLQPGTNLTAMDSNTYSISGTIANPTSMAFNGNTNTTAYIYANGQLVPDTSFVANGTEQATSTRLITKTWNDSGTVDGNGNYINSTSPVRKAAQISPVETKQTVISSPGKAQKGTIKTEVLGTKTTTTTGKVVTINKLSDNLAFANIGGLAEGGASTMASYDLMLDDITQAALNEHAKAINTLTELAVDAQNDKQTAFVDANGNKVVKTTDSTGTTEGYYLESDIDPTTGKARVGASTVAHSDIHVSLLDASGSTTTPTKLSNVADGTVAANSKDAVNGGQLFDVKTTAEAANTAVTTKGIKFDGDTGATVTRKLDETLNIKGNTATSAVLTDGNIGVVSNGTDTLLVKLAQKINLGTAGSVTMGNTAINSNGLTSKDTTGNTTIVNGSGVSFTNSSGTATGPSITKDGINAGNKTISNVATAVNGTEAVNKAQLDAAIAAIPATGGATTLKTAADNSTTGTVALGTQSLAVNGTANYVTTTANGNAITVDLAQSIKDKINTAATVAGNGKDGRDGSNGTAGSSITGPTGKDGLNGKDLTNKTNAIRNGEAGIIVYTNDAGERLVKANDGNYYKAADVNADGTTVAGATAVTNPVASLVNPDGTTTGATTKLTNVANGTVAANSKEAVNGGQLFDVKTTAEAANTAVTTKGIKFDGDTGATVTRKLDETLNIKGNTATSAVLTDGNIGVVSNGTDTLLVKLAQKINLGTAGSVTMGNTAINSNGLTSKDTTGNTTIVNGSGVSFTNSSGTATGPSITKDGINAGNKTISNVATAVNGTEAVNKAQLDAAIAAIPATGGATTLKTAADNSTTGTVALGTQSLAVNGTANYVTTTANGNAITVDLAQSIKDKINTAATVAGNGKDGRDGSNGTAGSSITGPTGKDGLNGKDLTDKTNAIRNGEAGIIVYTNDAGERLVKANDGNYYKAADVNADGTTVAGATAVTNPVASLVNPDGTTTGGTTKLTNVADGTVAANSKDAVNGGQLFDVKTTADAANTAVTTKGIKFDGDTGATVTRKLDETLNIKGNTATSAVLTDGNIGVVSNGTDTLLVKLAQKINLGTAGSVTMGNTAINSNGLTSKDTTGNTTIVNGSGVSFTNSSGTATGPSITKDGINAGNKTISNVATAVNGTEAVNKAQLDAAIAAIPATGGATTLKTAADNSTTGTVALGTQSLAVNGTANYVTTTANGNAITVDLAQSIKDKINTAATVAGNGKDGRDGSNGTAGSSITGPTGKDGLNGKDLTNKTNAIRNGEAGIIVYTNDAGERLVKANDGNYYKAADVNADGTTVAGATAVTNPVASLVNPDGTTTGATTKLTNVANGTVAANSKEAVNGGQLFDVKTTAEAANTAVTTKGIKFDGDTGATVTRKLDETLNIKGNTATSAVLTDGNIGVVSNGTDTLLVKLAQKINLGTAGSVTMGNTAINSNGLTSKDTTGNTTIVNGSGVSFTNSSGTATGPSITKDGINAGNKTISNVATAVNGTEAVNKAQLDAAIAAIPATGGATTLKTAADNSTTGTVALGTQSLAVNGTANYVTTTANGNAITVDLAQSIKDKINTAATVAGNGKDGRDGSNGTAGSSITGPTGKDGLNGKDLTDKTNAIRNGEAGIIVYTNDAGERLVKANDGNYYKAAEVNADGTTVAGATAVTNPVASLVNPDGTTTGATTKLTNVADGTVAANSKDAVNGGQLFDVKTTAEAANTAVTTKGIKFDGDTGATVTRKLDETLNIKGNTATSAVLTDGNIGVVSNGTDTLLVKLAQKINLGTAGSVTMGNTAINSNGLTSKDTTGNTTIVNGSGVSFTNSSGTATGPSITKDGINAGNKTISNVATAVNGTDAVNLTQVRNMISGIGGGAHSKVTAGNNIKVTESLDTATNGKVFNVALKDSISVTNVTTTDAAGNTTVTNGNGVTITGASSPTSPGKTVSLTTDGLNNGGNQIHNVAPGTSATDAATVGQVQATLSGVNSAFNGLDSKINTTGANAAALAGLKPLQYDPLEPTQIMAAYGHYHNKSAVAVGVAHFTDESTMFHAGVTLDDQNNMFNVGVTKKVGSSTAKKEIPERYKGGPISSIYVMNDEITALKEENARIKQENEDTKAKLAMVMAKLGL